MKKNINIHNKTEKVKKRVSKPSIGKIITPATLAPQKETLASQKPSLGDKKAIIRRKKTTRSGNAFIRPPRQNLLIMRHKVILRFD